MEARTARLFSPLLAAMMLASSASCSGGSGTAPDDEAFSEAGDGADGDLDDAERDRGRARANGQARGDGDGPRRPGRGSGTDGRAGGGGGAGAIDPALRTASVIVTEPRPNAQTGGSPPPYTELVAAAVEGLGDRFRVTLTFADDIPAKMPDENTFMVVAVGLMGRHDDQRYGFGAQATERGWSAHAGGEGRTPKRFPGSLRIAGSEIEMTIRWRFIRGPYRFRWQANSSWFRSVAGANHYAFDAIPRQGEARYPGS
jgi:hypothetical protein